MLRSSPKRLRRRREFRKMICEALEPRLMLDSAMAEMVRDIHTGTYGSGPDEFAEFDGRLFFVADDPLLGRELFVLDGSEPASLFMDIFPGAVGSEPDSLTAVGDTLYFTAEDVDHGRELWKTDGTVAGTMLVADLFPGGEVWDDVLYPFSSYPSDLTAAGDRLFFVAEAQDTGRELWMADGGGAAMLADLTPGLDEFSWPRSTEPRELTFFGPHLDEQGAVVDPALYFSAESAARGRELYKAAVTGEISLVKNIHEDREGDDPKSSDPKNLFVFQDRLYFAAKDGEWNDAEQKFLSHGVELWRSDGTSAGTDLFVDINEDPTSTATPKSSHPGGFAAYNGALYFSAYETSVGSELFKSDGTAGGTQLLRNLRSGSEDSFPSDLTPTDTGVFFVADGGQGRELWFSDGSTVGTQLVRDIRPGANHSLPKELTALGGSLLFSASDGTHGRELWISDSTLSGTVMLKDIRPGSNLANGEPENLTNIGGTVYFKANDVWHGRELWKTDGTADGTVLMDIPSVATQSSHPDSLASYRGRVYFAATSDEHGSELWKSDGSAEGTVLVKDIYPGHVGAFPLGADPKYMTVAGDLLFFVATDASHGSELWRTDGTEAGTMLVRDIDPSGSSYPSHLIAVDDLLFFEADSGAEGRELWVSDGTAAGTHLVHDIMEGSRGSNPHNMVAWDGLLYFAAEGAEGVELWRSNGDSAGTELVADIHPDGNSFPSELTVVNGLLFFAANDGTRGEELWITDGTPEGTMIVADLFVTAGVDFSGSNPRNLKNVDNVLFFQADDGLTGHELWTSDGTPDGTQPVVDIRDGPFGSTCAPEGSTRGLAAVFLQDYFFLADDGATGCELWRSNGTVDGTLRVTDLGEGDEDSEISELLPVGDLLYFVGQDVAFDEFGTRITSGLELWVTDGTSDGTQVHTEVNLDEGRGGEPQDLTNVGATVFFSADDGVFGRELWTTNRKLKADDRLFEILAKGIAYRDLPENVELDIQAQGYSWPVTFQVTPFRDFDTGFDAFGLTSEAMDPILIIRGTVDLLKDWYTDADPRGIGIGQYLANRDPVIRWISDHTTESSFVSITGHSLGGALSQLFAADATASGIRLDQIVTFNAPGLMSDYAEQFRSELADRVIHYVTNGDLVSMAGEQFLSGTWRRANFDEFSPKSKHVLPVIVDRIFIQGEDDRERPADLAFEAEVADVDWLNHPFYFHTEPDYYKLLGAMQLVTTSIQPLNSLSHLPRQLLFRSTAEAKRQEIGELWHSVQETISTVLDVVTCGSASSKITVPDLRHELFGLRIEATDMAASCILGPPDTMRLQGKVNLPQLYNVTADFADPNYIALNADGFDVVGTVTAQEIPIVPGFLGLEDVQVSVNTVTNAISAAGTLDIEAWDAQISGMLGFIDNQWNDVAVSVDGLDLPLTFVLPGAYLQRLSGSVRHVAEADPAPVEFGGGVGMTLGPVITVYLPSWAGGNRTAKLFDLDVNGVFDRHHLAASGDVDILNNLAEAGLTVDVNWHEGFFEANGSFDVLNGLIHSDQASFRADSDFNLNMGASASFQTPDSIPLIGGTQVSQGNFYLNFTNDSQSSNDSVAAWSVFTLPIIGDVTLGFRVWFDASFGLVGADSIPELSGGAGEGEDPPVAGANYGVAADTPWSLFAAEWDSEQAGELVLVMPDGTVLDEAAIAARGDMELVTEFSGLRRRVVAVDAPAAGIWRVGVADAAGLEELRFEAVAANAAPQVSLDQPTGGQWRSDVVIPYTASDPDSVAEVAFFYDVDGQGADGVRIGAANEADRPDVFTWSVGNVPPGTYHIYAVTDDGANPPVTAYAPGAIEISAPGISGTVWYDLNANGQRDPEETAATGVAVFLDLDGNGVRDDGELLDVTRQEPAGEYRFLDLTPDTYRVVVVPPPGYVPAFPAEDGAREISLAADTLYADVDFGLRRAPAGVSGVVWRDQNRDGFRDATEPVLREILVELRNTSGDQVLDSTLSDSEGRYEFQQLVPDAYRVAVALPRIHDLTTKHALGHDAFDNDITPLTFQSDLLDLAAGQNTEAVDIGLFNRWQNPRNRMDVTDNGVVTPEDVLSVINYITMNGYELPDELSSPAIYLDVDGNGFVVPLDVLLVISFLNNFQLGGEGEAASDSTNPVSMTVGLATRGENITSTRNTGDNMDELHDEVAYAPRRAAQPKVARFSEASARDREQRSIVQFDRELEDLLDVLAADALLVVGSEGNAEWYAYRR